MATTTQPSLPTTEDYQSAGDALWREAQPEVERIWFAMEAIVQLDENDQNDQFPDVTLEDIGRLWVFVSDAKVALDSMTSFVNSIEAAMETLRHIHAEKRLAATGSRNA